MIGDMYTNAENKTQNEREEIKWTYDLAAMEARRVKDITDSVEAVRKLEGTSVDYNKPPTPDNYAEHYLSITTDDFGELEFGTYDPYIVVNRAAADKQNPETAWQKFLEYSASNIYSKTESGNFTDEINKYKNIFKGYINNAADKEVYDKFVDGWFRVKKTLSDATFEGLKEYIGDETESIKKAMRDLTGESRLNKPKTVANRASFINGQQGKIGDLAPALFDSYITQVAAGSEPEDTFSALYSLSDKDFASQLASDLSNSILTL